MMRPYNVHPRIDESQRTYVQGTDYALRANEFGIQLTHFVAVGNLEISQCVLSADSDFSETRLCVAQSHRRTAKAMRSVGPADGAMNSMPLKSFVISWTNHIVPNHAITDATRSWATMLSEGHPQDIEQSDRQLFLDVLPRRLCAMDCISFLRTVFRAAPLKNF